MDERLRQLFMLFIAMLQNPRLAGVTTERNPGEEVANEPVQLKNMQGNTWQNLQQPAAGWRGNVGDSRPYLDPLQATLDLNTNPLRFGPRLGRNIYGMMWPYETREGIATVTSRLLDQMDPTRYNQLPWQSQFFGGPGFGNEPVGYKEGTQKYEDWMINRGLLDPQNATMTQALLRELEKRRR